MAHVMYKAVVFPAWRGVSGDMHPAIWSLFSFKSRRAARVYQKKLARDCGTQDMLKDWPRSQRIKRAGRTERMRCLHV